MRGNIKRQQEINPTHPLLIELCHLEARRNRRASELSFKDLEKDSIYVKLAKEVNDKAKEYWES